MLNRFDFIGRLGGDPEIQMTTSGITVARFSLATDFREKDESGQYVTKTDWHRCVLFGKTAEVARDYLKKGDMTFLSGRIRHHQWTDRDGVKKFGTEFIANELKLLPNGRKGSASQSETEPTRSVPDTSDPDLVEADPADITRDPF